MRKTNKSKSVQREELTWDKYWPEDLKQHVINLVNTLNAEDDITVESTLKFCAEDHATSSWILNSDKPDVINGRTQVAFQLFQLIKNTPELLTNVFKDAPSDEPPGWWQALRGAGCKTAWFDFRRELATKYFRRSGAENAKNITREARSNSFENQAIFMSLLDDNQSMAVCLVALVGESKQPMVMGTVIKQGEMVAWPDHLRTPIVCALGCWLKKRVSSDQLGKAAFENFKVEDGRVTLGLPPQKLGG